MIADFFRNEKRIREENVPNEDDDEEDDDDEIEVKPHHKIIFKVEDYQSPPSFVPELQTDSEV
jgi:hypothetical protein